MNHAKKRRQIALLIVAVSVLAARMARADVVTDWNVKAGNIVIAARLGPPPANRVLAIVHTAVYEAVNAITRRYPTSELKLEAAPGASVDAAVAAANRATLTKLMPSERAVIDSAYQAALAMIADGPAKTEGITVGEKAAAAILALRADDGAAIGETYRPYTTAGVYVPTVIPVVTQWPQRKPWLMTSPAQFRPGPPPKLTSDVWARDYNEVKAFGGAVLQAEIGAGSAPTLTTTSYAANGAARSWTKIEDFMQEVANARIYDGVHYRNSNEVGAAMGKRIGELAAAKFLRPLK